jgi:hypothetical protein
VIARSKLRERWSRLQGRGGIAFDFNYKRSGERWAFEKLELLKSNLPAGQDEIALRCMQESISATSFPVEKADVSEAYAKTRVVRWKWPVPLPPKGAKTVPIARASTSGLPDSIVVCEKCEWSTASEWGGCSLRACLSRRARMSKVSHDPPLLRISAALYDWGFWHLRKCHHLLGRSVTGMDTDGTGSKEPRTVSYLRIPGVRIGIVSTVSRTQLSLGNWRRNKDGAPACGRQWTNRHASRCLMVLDATVLPGDARDMNAT